MANGTIPDGVGCDDGEKSLLLQKCKDALDEKRHKVAESGWPELPLHVSTKRIAVCTAQPGATRNRRVPRECSRILPEQRSPGTPGTNERAASGLTRPRRSRSLGQLALVRRSSSAGIPHPSGDTRHSPQPSECKTGRWEWLRLPKAECLRTLGVYLKPLLLFFNLRWRSLGQRGQCLPLLQARIQLPSRRRIE